MRLAILSDVMGNRAAFDAVLLDAAARGCDQIALLGDLTGEGADTKPFEGAHLAREASYYLRKAKEMTGRYAIRATKLSGKDQSDARDLRPELDMADSAPASGMDVAYDIGVFNDQALEEGILFTVEPADVGGEDAAIALFRTSPARLIFCARRHSPLLLSRDRGGVLRHQTWVPGQAQRLSRARRWLITTGTVGASPGPAPFQAQYARLDTEIDELTFINLSYLPQPHPRNVGARISARPLERFS